MELRGLPDDAAHGDDRDSTRAKMLEARTETLVRLEGRRACGIARCIRRLA